MAMLLAATSAGLGSLLFGVFGNESDVATTFGIPGDRRILGAVALGWPDGDDRPSASAWQTPPDTTGVHPSRAANDYRYRSTAVHPSWRLM